jgi:hypothetical protein
MGVSDKLALDRRTKLGGQRKGLEEARQTASNQELIVPEGYPEHYGSDSELVVTG